jgi:acyl carrier protein phosphodiesterase
LGHAYFSFNHPEILVGNLISDFVKGKKKFDFPAGIQAGIQLHRELDDFSDNHEATRRAKEIFRPHYRLYAAAFVDVSYDYFIANDAGLFNETSLLAFTEQTYRQLEQYEHCFPEKFAHMFPFMKAQNWLYNYRHSTGIEKSFGGLVRRASYIEESETASRLFKNNLAVLQECYDHFGQDVKEFAKSRFDSLINRP